MVTTRIGEGGVLRRCTRCLLPETQETITFDDQGVCSVCRQSEVKQNIDWGQRKKDLDAIIAKYRKNSPDYDAIVPYSGGKDSTFTAYYLYKEYGLRTLLVSYNHGFYTPTANYNRSLITQQISCNVESWGIQAKTQRKTMLEGLRRKGDFCWPCHVGIFTYPMRVAVERQIPLIIWGEPSAEYTSYYSYDNPEQVDEKRFNRFVNLGISADDMAGMIPNATKRDKLALEALRYPSLQSLRSIGYNSICLGSYIPWDTEKQSEIIKRELGWLDFPAVPLPGKYSYEKIECRFQGVRDYLKFIKRGFGRTAHLASLDLRRGRISEAQANGWSAQYDGYRPDCLDEFLHYVGITEAEFNTIAASHAVAPHVPLFTAEMK